MSPLLLWLAAVLVLALAWWWWRKPPAHRPGEAPPPPAPPKARPEATPRQTPSASPPVPPPTLPPAPVVVTAPPPALGPVPPELASFQWRPEAVLDSDRRQALETAVRGIPRPPRSMQQLLSPEFLTRASSTELSELVMGEPLIAAKVLAKVNSPYYGLRQPVTGIGQAVTFLGINTVRSICLQYMLADAFKPTLAEAQKAFDSIWQASGLASELAVRLGKALNLPDQSALATQVVLGFVGQLATASLIPAAGLPAWLHRDRLARARLEQDLLGLNAVEIGGMLMRSWELPNALVNDVSDMGRLLITPPLAIQPARLARIALGYLCVRLGERLALEPLPVEQALGLGDGPDTHHLRAAIAQDPVLAGLPAALQAPDLIATMRLATGQVTPPAVGV